MDAFDSADGDRVERPGLSGANDTDCPCQTPGHDEKLLRGEFENLNDEGFAERQRRRGERVVSDRDHRRTRDGLRNEYASVITRLRSTRAGIEKLARNDSTEAARTDSGSSVAGCSED